jgi:hypothetical protein
MKGINNKVRNVINLSEDERYSYFLSLRRVSCKGTLAAGGIN